MRKLSEETKLQLIEDLKQEQVMTLQKAISQRTESVAETLRREDRQVFVDKLFTVSEELVEKLEARPVTVKETVEATISTVLKVLDGSDETPGYAVVSKDSEFAVISSLDIAGDLHEAYFESINT